MGNKSQWMIFLLLDGGIVMHAIGVKREATFTGATSWQFAVHHHCVMAFRIRS